jgi:hypothetical protein
MVARSVGPFIHLQNRPDNIAVTETFGNRRKAFRSHELPQNSRPSNIRHHCEARFSSRVKIVVAENQGVAICAEVRVRESDACE